jgi:hypothetical protein
MKQAPMSNMNTKNRQGVITIAEIRFAEIIAMIVKFLTRRQLGCQRFLLVMAGLMTALWADVAMAQVALQDIGFTPAAGSRFEIELEFSTTPPTPEIFVIEAPARLTMDFTNVTSQLTERRFPLQFPGADSVMILEAQGRTRMVVNLTGAPDYSTRVQGNSLFVSIGVPGAAAQAVTAAPQAPAPAAAPSARGICSREQQWQRYHRHRFPRW